MSDTINVTYIQSQLFMVKKNALAFVPKDTEEQDEKCLSVKKTHQSYSGEVYFSSLEKHESLHKICYLNHIKF